MESACRGDVQAFAQLYDLYASTIMGLAVRLVQDECRAEEIVHRAFVGIWSEMRTPGFNAGSFFTRLSVMARGLAANANQGYQAKNNRGQGNLKAIELVYFKGYTYSDAARELNLTVAELKTRIRNELNAYRGVITK